MPLSANFEERFWAAQDVNENKMNITASLQYAELRAKNTSTSRRRPVSWQVP